MAKPQPLVATDKLTFLLSLVPYLIDRGVVTVTEVANDFDVAPAYVRSIVPFLGTAGLPGDTSTYQHSDLFDIDWDALEQHDEVVLRNYVGIEDVPRFSTSEIAALLAGLQYLSGLPEFRDSGDIDLLMQKLRGGADGPLLSTVSIAPHEFAGSAGEQRITLARQAVAEGRQLDFYYRNADGEQAQRTVDAQEVVSTDDVWYLRGWDHLREAPRMFRLDRMTAVQLGETIDPTHRREAYDPEFLEQDASQQVVTLDVSAAGFSLIQDFQPVIFDPEAPVTAQNAKRPVLLPPPAIGERALARIRVSSFAGITRLASTHSAELSIVDPPEARTAVSSWAKAALDLYGS
ncbi:helix-turn-helix transcriptional regulator [Lysinibacter cavernae]|uniref:Proteasome accessory factor C n=1 Tax=Lysinibacter cavernae TaxID=1640652 RepID=A0A7X5QZF7_9MICO|nr:WYL domain-containing protein [Lysinibacter cavernae]NIH52789.1 proteasome accessory factor C [Lysinibacter cavernae]